jgi:hypothetical protein
MGRAQMNPDESDERVNCICVKAIAKLRSGMPSTYGRCRAVAAGWWGVLLAGLATILWAQPTQAPDLQAQQNQPPQVSASELLKETVARELEVSRDPSVKHMFRSRRQTPRGSQTRLYVETNDSMAGMLIALNDQPLNPQQKQAEMDHLAWLANNPEQLRKKRAREKEDTERSLRILKALPEAFRYEYAGTENSEPGLGKAGDPLLRLKFTPNPDYNPPSHVEQVLEGMQGDLLIDPSLKRFARVDGTLFREVSFGWGIIGHLDKGGHLRVEQGDVGDGTWQITHMSLRMMGKFLMFKSFNIDSVEVYSDFQRVPADLTFAKGVEMLKSAEEKLAHNGETDAANKHSR